MALNDGSLKPEDVIRGGCPDGFWVRQNCDQAARFGLCSMTTIEDRRPAYASAGVSPGGSSSSNRCGSHT
jgi:hypothetical protein